eukprot:scaffold35714_cov51-Isochrysis_galbana.AAC.1
MLRSARGKWSTGGKGGHALFSDTSAWRLIESRPPSPADAPSTPVRTACWSVSASGGWEKEKDKEEGTGVAEARIGGLSLTAVDADRSNQVWCTSWSFTQ